MADLFDLFTVFDGKDDKENDSTTANTQEKDTSSRSSSPQAKRARVLKNPVMVKLINSCRVPRNGSLTWVNMVKHVFGDKMARYLEQRPLVHLQTACSGTGCAHISLEASSFRNLIRKDGANLTYLICCIDRSCGTFVGDTETLHERDSRKSDYQACQIVLCGCRFIVEANVPQPLLEKSQLAWKRGYGGEGEGVLYSRPEALVATLPSDIQPIGEALQHDGRAT
eukprot:6491874-Amphidinium_carterae.1